MGQAASAQLVLKKRNDFHIVSQIALILKFTTYNLSFLIQQFLRESEGIFHRRSVLEIEYTHKFLYLLHILGYLDVEI